MTGNEYQKMAMRTNDRKGSDRMEKALDIKCIDMGGAINASLGLSGETGELNDMLKKSIFHEHPLDIEHVEKEIGDILWYVAMMCESFGLSMDEIMQINIDKLKARYPEGFDPEKSLHRKEWDV